MTRLLPTLALAATAATQNEHYEYVLTARQAIQRTTEPRGALLDKHPTGHTRELKPGNGEAMTHYYTSCFLHKRARVNAEP